MVMRPLALSLLLLAGAALAGDPPRHPASDDEAKAALAAFEEGWKTAKTVEEKQHVVYNLHDVRHDLVLARIEKLLRDKNPAIRNVAALALGGQTQNVEKSGGSLMKSFQADYKETQVLSSVLMGVEELGYLRYWPQVEVCLKDERNEIVIRTLNLLGKNKDYRALPKLLEMYRIALPKRVSWSTGEVTVDTGAEGTADAEAAEAKFNATYGAGGSKMKAKATAKARSQDDRNFSVELRRSVKAITGEDFPTVIDFEDWYLKNYLAICRRIAEMDGKDPAAAEKKAAAELPLLKQKIDEERKKLEEEAEASEKEREGRK